MSVRLGSNVGIGGGSAMGIAQRSSQLRWLPVAGAVWCDASRKALFDETVVQRGARRSLSQVMRIGMVMVTAKKVLARQGAGVNRS